MTKMWLVVVDALSSVNNIEHLTTASFHPESNGEAERFVRTFKTALKKNCFDGTSSEVALIKFLATYRATPLANCDQSPAEILHGRQPRTLLSSLAEPERMYEADASTTKFKIYDSVFVKDYAVRGTWRKGHISKCLGRRLYLVVTNYGTWKRHQNQLRPRVSVSSEAENQSKTLFNQKNSSPQKSSPHERTTDQDKSAVELGSASPAIILDQPSARATLSELTVIEEPTRSQEMLTSEAQPDPVRRSARVPTKTVRFHY